VALHGPVVFTLDRSIEAAILGNIYESNAPDVAISMRPGIGIIASSSKAVNTLRHGNTS
jgi:hypothetical protein